MTDDVTKRAKGLFVDDVVVRLHGMCQANGHHVHRDGRVHYGDCPRPDYHATINAAVKAAEELGVLRGYEDGISDIGTHNCKAVKIYRMEGASRFREKAVTAVPPRDKDVNWTGADIMLWNAAVKAYKKTIRDLFLEDEATDDESSAE